MGDVKTQTGGLCAWSVNWCGPPGACRPARQASLPDSPPQAIHGLLYAYPGRDAAPAIRCHDFFIRNRSVDAYAWVIRVLPALDISQVYFCLNSHGRNPAASPVLRSDSKSIVTGKCV